MAGGWCGGFGFTKGLFVEFLAGGGLSTAILRPGGRKQSRRLVPDNNNTTIKQWTKGSGHKWGVCMGGRLDLPFLPCIFYLNMVKKKVGWTGVRTMRYTQ